MPLNGLRQLHTYKLFLVFCHQSVLCSNLAVISKTKGNLYTTMYASCSYQREKKCTTMTKNNKGRILMIYVWCFPKIKPWCLIYSWDPKFGNLSAQGGDHLCKVPSHRALLMLGISQLVFILNANVSVGMVIKSHVLKLKPDSNCRESLRWSNTKEKLIPCFAVMNLETFYCNIQLLAKTDYRTKWTFSVM